MCTIVVQTCIAQGSTVGYLAHRKECLIAFLSVLSFSFCLKIFTVTETSYIPGLALTDV